MRKKDGAALIMVVTLSTLLLLTAFAVAMNSVSDVSLTSDDNIKTKLELASLSGIKRATVKIEQSFNNKNLTFLEPDVSFQGSDQDDSGLSPNEKAFEDETFESGSNLDYYTYTYNSDIENQDIIVIYSINGAANWDRSQNYTSYDLDIESIAYAPGYGWVGMQQEATVRRTTLFMYQVFFENDLEILPGAKFDLKGLVHTNEDMYLSGELSIYTDSMTSAGEMSRYRLDNPSSTGGDVRITKEDEDGDLISMRSGIDESKRDNWIENATTRWQGTVRDKNLGATRLEAPDLESFEPGGYYDQNADLKIEVLAEGQSLNTTRYRITLNGATSTYYPYQLNGAIKEVEFYDRREYGTSKKMRTTQIDIEKLNTTLGYPTNGLVYMTRDDAQTDNDGNPYYPDPQRKVSGFKIKNGDELPASSTFVSNLPTYIQGDFNLHTNDNPELDKWKPCAVISDAITLLSNSWNDSNYNTKPTASNTKYNTVFITGNNPSKLGCYSGGLENFPRFLENWSGKNAEIKGGFIQLFRSQYATGEWNSSYYSPPIRKWGSEERFSDLTNLPPSYAALFPSTNLGVAYSNWSQISKDESEIGVEYEN